MRKRRNKRFVHKGKILTILTADGRTSSYDLDEWKLFRYVDEIILINHNVGEKIVFYTHSVICLSFIGKKDHLKAV